MVVGATRGNADVENGGALAKPGRHNNRFKRNCAPFDRPKLEIPYWHSNFDQNRSCRGKDALQLCFWAKIDLELGLGIKGEKVQK